MAVVEIARIQVRRGVENVTGVPQLAAGEFGWAQDTENLYIGKRVDEGASTDSNSRILTEKDLISNIFAITNTNYTYIGHGVTPPDTNGTIRSVQSKLDDFVTIYDFSISTTTSITAAIIQQAIDELFLQSYRTNVALRIPAGNFNIDTTLKLPPNTFLLGDGKGRTVLNLTAATPSALMQFIAQDGAEYQDGLTNISSNYRPSHITVSGITLKYDSSLSLTGTVPLLRADCAVESSIIGCEFKGIYSLTSSSNASYAGIDIRGQGAITSENLQIIDCSFDNLYYGIKSNYDIEDTIIENCKFNTLYRGVVHSESIATGNSTGPVRSKIKGNRFYNIKAEGIYVGSNPDFKDTDHISSYNVFKEVGNAGAGDFSPSTSIIRFDSLGNQSIGDHFVRFNTINSTGTSGIYIQNVIGNSYVDNNKLYTKRVLLTATPRTVATFPVVSTGQSLKLDYSIAAPSVYRKGQLFINSADTTATITDSYSYTGNTDGDVVFGTNINTTTNILRLYYTSSGVSNGILEYKFTILQ